MHPAKAGAAGGVPRSQGQIQQGPIRQGPPQQGWPWTEDAAIRLAGRFGSSPRYWMNSPHFCTALSAAPQGMIGTEEVEFFGEPKNSTSSVPIDRKSTRLNSSHQIISYAVFCLKKKKIKIHTTYLNTT